MRNRITIPALAGAILLTSLGLSPTSAQKGPGDPEPPITLRLLVQDSRGRQSEPAALDLARLADELTDGAITIVPAFDGGDVATAVMNGETELGMVPSRDWDSIGVTSLDVLEAPLLIDNDPLALAVATSDIADRAMAGLDAVGVSGLAMWPEDLRHLFALDPSGADFSTPEGLADADVLVVAGQPGHDLITELGGRIYEEGVPSGDLAGDRGIDAAAGTLEGMVTGLWGAGLPTDDVTVAGDLVVYSKYQMLVANAQMLDGLTDRQRELLDEVVDAMQQAALGRQFTEAELALERCAKGGTVVSVGADAVEAFKVAAQPLTDRLAADPVTGELMAAVQALKQRIPAAPGAGTCDPTSARSRYPVSDPTGFMATLPPEGSYRADITVEDLLAKGVAQEWATLNSGIFTITFQEGAFGFDHPRDGRCDGTYETLGPSLLLRNDPGGCAPTMNVLWRPDADGISLLLADQTEEDWPMIDFTNIQAHLEGRTWIRLEGPMPSVSPAVTSTEAPPSGETAFVGGQPVPNGVYRILVTTDELQAAGATRDFAGRNAGTWEWTFTDGAWSAVHGGERCNGATSVAGDHIEMTDLLTTPCAMGYDLRWRVDGDGIRFQVLDTNWMAATAQDLVNERALTERVWTRISDAPGDAFIGDRMPPDGVYRAEMTVAELVSLGATPAYAADTAGMWTSISVGDRWTMTHSRTGATCSGDAAIVGNVIRWTDDPEPAGCYGAGDWRWRLEGDGIRTQYVPNGAETAEELANYRAFNDRVWTRIADAPPASALPSESAFIGDRLPPAGTYRMEYSREDAVAAGASAGFAGANAGVWTWTLDGAAWVAEHGGEECDGTAEVTDGAVLFRTVTDNGCGMDYLVRWRDDGDGMTFEIAGFPGASTPSDATIVDERTFIERTWTRLE